MLLARVISSLRSRHWLVLLASLMVIDCRFSLLETKICCRGFSNFAIQITIFQFLISIFRYLCPTISNKNL